MKAIDVVRSALVLARSRLTEMPSYPIYASCVAQLEYLLSTLDGRVAVDRSNLRTFTIGHYAAREFEESDEELSRALKDAYLIAPNLADGSRIT